MPVYMAIDSIAIAIESMATYILAKWQNGEWQVPIVNEDHVLIANEDHVLIRVHLSPGSSCGLLAYASVRRYYNFPHICG